jgi:predicted neuraminidase
MLNLAISEDGNHWRPVMTLDREPQAEFSYPAVIQSADGLVHITWTWKRQRVRHVVVQPTDLVPGDFRSHEWPDGL